MQYALLIYTKPGAAEALGADEQEANHREYLDIRKLPGVVGGAALHPVETATTVRVQDGHTLVTDFGDFDLAEEATAEAFAVAAQRWASGRGVFTAASLACALAPDSQVLVGFRFVQGAGAVVAHSFRVPQGRRARGRPGWINSVTMKAMSVIPGHRGSALIAESPDPPPTERSVLADPPWLGALISRRVPLSEWPQALTRQPGDVKVAVDLTK